MYPLSRQEIEEKMAEGAKAFLDKLEPEKNPYSIHTDYGRLWLRGYSNAKYGQSLT